MFQMLGREKDYFDWSNFSVILLNIILLDKMSGLWEESSIATRVRPIWIQPIPILIYVPGRYFWRYWYNWKDISATDTYTVFFISRYLAGNKWKCRYMPIFWAISKLFNRYLADTDKADIFLADKRYRFWYAYTDIQFEHGINRKQAGAQVKLG